MLASPPNGVRHTETVPWQPHFRKVLDCFGGLWRWMGLDGSGQLWTARVGTGELSRVREGSGRSWTRSGGFSMSLDAVSHVQVTMSDTRSPVLTTSSENNYHYKCMRDSESSLVVLSSTRSIV